MSDSIYDIKEFIVDYDAADFSLTFVGLESAFIALIIGILKLSVAWGIAAFIILMIIYNIPLLGGVLSIICSSIEACFVYGILTELHSASNISLFVSLFSFIGFIYLHRWFGSIRDTGIFGYSLLIAECLVISSFLWYSFQSIPIACILFVVLLVALFIPIIRGLEMIAVCLFISYTFYDIAIEIVERNYAIISALAVMLFTGIHHVFAYRKLDYIGMRQQLKADKIHSDALIAFNQLKEKIYAQHPDLDELYYYFKVGVCQNEEEQISFDADWTAYIYYLDKNNFCSFNDYFEKMQLYKFSTYNRDFAAEWKKHHEKDYESNKNFEHENTDSFNQSSSSSSSSSSDKKIVYFNGVSDKASLKKRYHELLKIYHPDNQNGDTETLRYIQEEYEYLNETMK